MKFAVILLLSLSTTGSLVAQPPRNRARIVVYQCQEGDDCPPNVPDKVQNFRNLIDDARKDLRHDTHNKLHVNVLDVQGDFPPDPHRALINDDTLLYLVHGEVSNRIYTTAEVGLKEPLQLRCLKSKDCPDLVTSAQLLWMYYAKLLHIEEGRQPGENEKGKLAKDIRDLGWKNATDLFAEMGEPFGFARQPEEYSGLLRPMCYFTPKGTAAKLLQNEPRALYELCVAAGYHPRTGRSTPRGSQTAGRGTADSRRDGL